MIDVRELRIGNWLNEYGTPVQVTGITITDPPYLGITHTPNSIGATHGNDLDPIALSPEILTQWCGFEKNEINERLFFTHPDAKRLCGHKFEVSYYEFSGDALLDGFYFDAGHPYDTHVKTLHHLQNLFFALTGTELEIKIPTKA